MRFYRLSMRDAVDSSHGFSFHTSVRAAAEAKAAFLSNYDEERFEGYEPTAEIEPLDIEPTKTGILAALNRYASHERNG